MYEFLRALANKYWFADRIEKLKKKGLVIGKNSSVLGGVDFDESHCWHVVIGDDVTLAPNVKILAHDASTKRHLGYTRIGKVQIGNRVFIGAASIILPGITIGDDVIIGAGSVVTHDVPSGTVVAGNPARIVGPLTAFLEKRRGEMARVPCFGGEYTIRQHVSDQMKAEMNAKMTNGCGYVK